MRYPTYRLFLTPLWDSFLRLFSSNWNLWLISLWIRVNFKNFRTIRNRRYSIRLNILMGGLFYPSVLYLCLIIYLWYFWLYMYIFSLITYFIFAKCKLIQLSRLSKSCLFRQSYLFILIQIVVFLNIFIVFHVFMRQLIFLIFCPCKRLLLLLVWQTYNLLWEQLKLGLAIKLL